MQIKSLLVTFVAFALFATGCNNQANKINGEAQNYNQCIEKGGETGVLGEAGYCKFNGQVYYLTPPPGTVN